MTKEESKARRRARKAKEEANRERAREAGLSEWNGALYYKNPDDPSATRIKIDYCGNSSSARTNLEDIGLDEAGCLHVKLNGVWDQREAQKLDRLLAYNLDPEIRRQEDCARAQAEGFSVVNGMLFYKDPSNPSASSNHIKYETPQNHSLEDVAMDWQTHLQLKWDGKWHDIMTALGQIHRHVGATNTPRQRRF